MSFCDFFLVFNKNKKKTAVAKGGNQQPFSTVCSFYFIMKKTPYCIALNTYIKPYS
jgi:hypothetical protein